MTWIITYILWTFHATINGFYMWIDPYPVPLEQPIEMRAAEWVIGGDRGRPE